jgi:hypothetical protein
MAMAKIVGHVYISGRHLKFRNNMLTQKLHEAEAEMCGFSNRRAVVGDPRTIKQENPLAGLHNYGKIATSPRELRRN